MAKILGIEIVPLLVVLVLAMVSNATQPFRMEDFIVKDEPKTTLIYSSYSIKKCVKLQRRFHELVDESFKKMKKSQPDVVKA